MRPYRTLAVYAEGLVIAVEHYDHENPGSEWGECLAPSGETRLQS